MKDKIMAENSNKLEQAQKIINDVKDASGDTEQPAPSLDQVIDDLETKVKTKDGIKTVKELVDGSLMQADYTRKTQALKEKENEINKELGEYQSYASAVQTYFNDKPDKYQDFVNYFQNPDGSAAQSNEGQNGANRNAEYDRQLNETNKAIKTIQQQMEEDARMTRVNNAVSQLQTKYNLDQDELGIIITQANGDYNDKISEADNLDNAYAKVKAFLEKERKDVDQKNLVKNQEKASATFIGGSTKAQSNVKTVQEVVNDALSSVGDKGSDIL